MMGDVLADLAQLNELARSVGHAGNVGQWLSSRLQAFHRLPAETARLVQQSQAVRRILAGSAASLDALAGADRDLGRVQRDYAGVNARVQEVVAALLPYASRIDVGDYDSDVVTALAKNGTDILGAVYGMNDLIGTTERAQDAIERTVLHADIPQDVRQRALGALAGNGASLVPFLVAVGIGAVVIRAVMK